MRDKLKAWFWRDPDPIWRWASGQTIRRWWNRPLVLAGIASGILYFLDFVILLFVFGDEFDSWNDACEFGLYITSGIVALCTFVFFVLIAARPFSLLRRLGGPSMLRALSITPLGREEIPRRLFWGSYRNAALPFLTIAYSGILAVLILSVLSGTLFEMSVELYEFLTLGGFLAVVFVLKPPIDHLLNLSISWWFCFKTGRRTSGLIGALIVILAGFPLLRSILARVVMLPTGLMMWLIYSGWRTYAALAIAFMTIGGGLAYLLVVLRRRDVRPVFRYALLLTVATVLGVGIAPVAVIASRWTGISASFLVEIASHVGAYALKIWYARRCYRKFVQNWDTLLNEKFGD